MLRQLTVELAVSVSNDGMALCWVLPFPFKGRPGKVSDPESPFHNSLSTIPQILAIHYNFIGKSKCLSPLIDDYDGSSSHIMT